ncbi:ABC transporter substrate-binding protein [Bacillus sp. FSL W7-1360]
MKKAALSILLAATVLGACASESSKEGKTEQKKGGESAPAGKVEVDFWHSMNGELEKALVKLTEQFNESQDDVHVKLMYQGEYEDALTKLNTAAGTAEAPALMQTYEIGTKYMIDSGHFQPIQDLIDKEEYDTSNWEEAITKYYSLDGVQYSMPFNSSTPVLIYNKDAFKEAGLDPEKAPETYSELKEAAAALADKDYGGFSMLNYGWFIEQMIAVQGGLFINEDNGRAGAATEAVFNGDEGLRVFQLMSEMIQDETMVNVGDDWDSMRAVFQAGKTAMILDSSAGVRGLTDQATFDVGVAYLPVPDDVERQGVIIGGASLWMSEGLEEDVQTGAWEFMKYVSSPEAQAQWHVDTGYFAIDPRAYDEEIVKEEWEKYPGLKVTVDQLSETKPSPATQGAIMPVFPETREHVVRAMQSLYQGTDPQEALDQAAEATNQALQRGQ